MQQTRRPEPVGSFAVVGPAVEWAGITQSEPAHLLCSTDGTSNRSIQQSDINPNSSRRQLSRSWRPRGNALPVRETVVVETHRDPNRRHFQGERQKHLSRGRGIRWDGRRGPRRAARHGLAGSSSDVSPSTPEPNEVSSPDSTTASGASLPTRTVTPGTSTSPCELTLTSNSTSAG